MSNVAVLDLGGGRAELRLPPGALPALTDLRAVVADAFTAPDLHCLAAYVAVDSWAERRLLHETGFARDGVLRDWLPGPDGRRAHAWVGTVLRDDPLEPPHPWPEVPELEAGGLLLRPWRDADVPRIVEGCADAESQRWLGQMPAAYTSDAARAWLQDSAERVAEGTAMNWAVVDPGDPDGPDLALGSVGWFDLTAGVDCEVGYWTHPDARGRGVARRATEAVVAHAFGTLGVRRVRAFAAVDNVASRRVIEACGFELYGIERLGAWVRDGHVDMALYDRMGSPATTA
ncbi:GNAT family N-acetyltransferase [Nocardioides marmotae]|uniref:GNAT family N-acetyltransferase n=1 Tax=Nocardioides marmotae TaxID=2663857 RepID=UPI0012B5F9C8|nr:GNAT family N-acetyltransferase [Nocardioides marmotae]MBC9733676.1 GNAT family N-acetyltransferase [Nocardioides marmotae]MTB84779.1 GNAT family N-acetyltransferase [Nocardioides marmotae]